MKLHGRYINDFLALVFPELCQACGNSLVQHEDVLCTACTYDMPFTNFHNQPDNVVARQLWGRIDLQSAYAFLYFVKGGKVQNLMHQFKYRNMPQIGVKLGTMAGAQLSQSVAFSGIDLIVPVPLHPKKLRQRGYNQSERFAIGLAKKMNIPVSTDNLVRVVHTKTQTQQSRFSRYENMKAVFELVNPAAIEGKHILLVDDIVTTGSTLEACGIELLNVAGVKLSVAAIAYAE